jgi:hypothetical protein
LLAQTPVDITPKNGGNFPWTGKDLDEFEKEWSMKPVEIRGYVDMSKTQKVEKIKDTEKGFDFVSTMFTHLNKDE